MVSSWDWRDSIGDPDKRPPRLNPAWNEVQQNDLGIDDYMVLNKLLGMEPYICVNTGFGDAHSAAQGCPHPGPSPRVPCVRMNAVR